MKAVILFDGVCNLCNSAVQFIIKRDPAAYFTFAPLQEEKGKELLTPFKKDLTINSVILIENGRLYEKSAAALQICLHLQGAWKLAYIFKIIPSFIRDPIYDYVAKNRYKWFGKKDHCMLPTKDTKRRFL
ncbi:MULTISPECIES: thiol-disulfide oxidoreductase DCC family protein [Bacillaceae]|uniref:thiol-disulfide oxidoreductase DCC family protein n=1 Tax=Bacillaceae TaxID=186817 RepID=UPI001E5777E4|nr:MULTISPECIES: thiol-disulfide oxidoreductase DCC family protein [Bacillaceae]MCE4049662.1 thiol-disulfide oxidoreductase DCC family protein [Bacillus sp. Au-Bac7]MCM3031832.1 thiol-disulfide oxidoreductase DCC family protein [Niallia sp. MER 6]MDL0436965.1 thiol-disulfide oxidoreductase DCC family protein [Niallia sp. SS-2023]UPO87432.1 thiol-disulfide oxidoreductase DCC family protein [Niallia sp. Man26]